jgi:hypothetical protein
MVKYAVSHDRRCDFLEKSRTKRESPFQRHGQRRVGYLNKSRYPERKDRYLLYSPLQVVPQVLLPLVFLNFLTYGKLPRCIHMITQPLQEGSKPSGVGLMHCGSC